jgi:hypothetical protein
MAVQVVMFEPGEGLPSSRPNCPFSSTPGASAVGGRGAAGS